MKKKEDFCRESNHFLKSLGLALCLVSFGGSAIYASFPICAADYAKHSNE